MTTLRQALLGLASLPDLETVTFSRWAKETETETDFRYGQDFEPADFEKATLVSHRYLSGSDYSGGALVRANQKAVLAFADSAVTFHGSHGTIAVFFRLDVESEHAEEVASVLAGLDNYAAVSDDSFSEQEHEEELAAWESYARNDFLRSLEQEHGLERDEIALSHEALAELWRVADKGQGLVIHEDSGPHFETERAASEISAPLLFYVGRLSLDFAETARLFLDEGTRSEGIRLLRLHKIGETLRELAKRAGNGAHEAILRATIKAGDTSAALDLDAIGRPLDRAFVVDFIKGDRNLSLVLDPFEFLPYAASEALVSFLDRKN